MFASYLRLTYDQIALAATLIIFNGAISVLLGLGMGRTWFIASIRTVVQLLLIGSVLEWVFHLDRWYIVLALMAAMTFVAAHTAASRSDKKYTGIYLNTFISIGASSWLITIFALFVVIRRTETWYQPQYSIPLLGMLLGNTLNGISLGLHTFTNVLVNDQHRVETLLALGATKWEAARDSIGHAVRTGLIPIMNSMMVVGIVSLPGMMTGQLLSGTTPIDAVKYQIVIMFLIASATAMGTVGVVLLSYRRLFNADHQYMYQRLD